MSSISLKGELLGRALDVAVAKKGLETVEMQGEAAVQLIEQAGEVAKTAKAPPVRAHASHLGRLIDTYI